MALARSLFATYALPSWLFLTLLHYTLKIYSTITSPKVLFEAGARFLHDDAHFAEVAGDHLRLRARRRAGLHRGRPEALPRPRPLHDLHLARLTRHQQVRDRLRDQLISGMSKQQLILLVLYICIPLSFASQLGEHGHLLLVERAVPQDGQELRPLRLHLRPPRGPKGGLEVSQMLYSVQGWAKEWALGCVNPAS